MSRQEILRNYRKAGIILKRLEDFKFSQTLNTNRLNLFNRKLREFNILGESLYPIGNPRQNHNGKVRKYRGILNRRQIAMMPRAPTAQSKVNNFQRRVAQLRNSPRSVPVKKENNPMYVASPSSPSKSRSSPKSRSPAKSRSSPKSRSPAKGCFGGVCRRARSLIRRKLKR